MATVHGGRDAGVCWWPRGGMRGGRWVWIAFWLLAGLVAWRGSDGVRNMRFPRPPAPHTRPLR
jgi:hypothetical protein